MAKIRRDSHGLYLIAGGYYFRPIFPVGYRHVYKDGTSLNEGEKAVARHKGGTQLATVKSENVSEIWFSHGGTSGKTSEESFKPEYEIWKS